MRKKEPSADVVRLHHLQRRGVELRVEAAVREEAEYGAAACGLTAL